MELFTGSMHSSCALFLGGVDSGSLCSSGFDCAVGNVPASHTD